MYCSSTFLAVTVGAVLSAGAGQASAAEVMAAAPQPGVSVAAEQLMALTARLDALEARNRDLEAQVAALKRPVEPAKPKDSAAATAGLKNGRPSFATADGQFTASLRGYFQLDAARYDQDPAGPLATDLRRGSLGDATEADRARDLTDGTNFRRIRLGIEGKAFGDWNYNFLYDFGGSGVEEPGKVINAWVEYAGFKPFRIRAGAFAPPAGIDDATAVTSTLFLERAAPAELVRGIAGSDSRVGAGVLGSGQRWNLSAVLTGGTAGVQTFDEQLAFVGRAVYLPLRGEHSLIHLGVNTTIVVDPPASAPNVAPGVATPLRLRERPEMRVDGTRLVDTGTIDASGLTVLGAEFAAQYRALLVQGEYFDIKLRRRGSTLPDPDFNGWYLQGAWTITGQPRRYGIASGSFDTPAGKPGGWGVWELAARYSDLDLDYRAGVLGSVPVAAAVRGGHQRITSLGLNWQPNAVVRFQGNYQHVDIDRLSPGGVAFGAGALTPPAGAQVGQTFDIWSLRTQYAF